MTPNAGLIHEMLFGSAMDVIDRYLPDKDKHAVDGAGCWRFWAVNSTYRGAVHTGQRHLLGVRSSRCPTTAPR